MLCNYYYLLWKKGSNLLPLVNYHHHHRKYSKRKIMPRLKAQQLHSICTKSAHFEQQWLTELGKKPNDFGLPFFHRLKKWVKNICSNRHFEHAIKPQSANAKLKWLFVWRISFDKSILWQQHKRRQTSESINNSHFIL